MNPKPSQWLLIPAQVYADLFEGLGGNRAWGLYDCDTNCNTPHPCDQFTEWALDGKDCPLLRNQTRDGVHTYYLAHPVDVDDT